jgi:hypothetical protein
VSWLEDMSLRDLDESVMVETTCLRCTYVWWQTPTQLLLKVIHRDVRLDEVAKNLACPKHDCRHVGVRLTLAKNEETSGFVGGMP